MEVIVTKKYIFKGIASILIYSVAVVLVQKIWRI